MTQVIAVVENIHAGVRDTNWPCVWFTTTIPESVSALQVLPWDAAGALIQDSGCYKLSNLNGKTCWVEKNGNTMKFVRMTK